MAVDINGIDVNATIAKGRKKAGEKGKDAIGKTFGRILSELQRQSGGDEFAFEALAHDMLAKVISNGTSAPQVAASATPAGLTSGSSTVTAAVSASNTQLSDAEKLGKELLALHGDDTDKARGSLTFIKKSQAAGTNVLRLFDQTVAAVTRDNHPEDVVREGGQLMLASDRDARRKAEELERVVYDLLQAVHGAIVPAAKTSDLLADAKVELKELRAKAAASTTTTAPSEDKFLQELVRVTNVKPLNGETFNSYVARVVAKINTGAGVGTTGLLDELAKILDLKRNGKTDDDFKAEILAATAESYKRALWYDATWTELEKIANTRYNLDTTNKGAMDLVKAITDKLEAILAQRQESEAKARKIAVHNGVTGLTDKSFAFSIVHALVQQAGKKKLTLPASV